MSNVQVFKFQMHNYIHAAQFKYEQEEIFTVKINLRISTRFPLSFVISQMPSITFSRSKFMTIYNSLPFLIAEFVSVKCKDNVKNLEIRKLKIENEKRFL